MLFIVIIVFVLASMFSAISNPDLFSPSKLFLFFFLVFHVGGLFTDITETTTSLILVVLLVGLLIAFFEAGRIQQNRLAMVVQPIPDGSTDSPPRDYALLLWLISLPGLAAQIYMIQHFGGIEGYVNSVGLRVVEWAGFGWARTLIAVLTPINMVYFAVGLRRRSGLAWWAFYGAHFLILLGIGLLSGSRSSLLNVFVMQILIFHYLRARVRGGQAVLLTGGLVLSAMALGVWRAAARFNEGVFTVTNASSDRALSFDSFYYGIQPLEIITRAEYMPLAHGSTFFSLLTNAIPRALWPNKPDSGGIFFTQNYAGDAWLGYSNLTPTFLGEWLINFGWVAGVIGFFICYSAIMFAVVRYYMRVTQKIAMERSTSTAIDLVIYVHVALAFVALMVGETTNVVLTLVVTQLIPLWIIRAYIRRVEA